MDFADPFGGNPPDRDLIYGEAPSEPGVRPPVPHEFDEYVGLPGFFRLIAAASPIRGWPQGLHVGSVCLYQTNRPVFTKRAYITQLPGRAFALDKTMHHFDACAGRFVTLAVLPVLVPDYHLAAAMGEWHDECLAALGILASFLDERVCQELVAGDLIVCDRAGRAIAHVDCTPHVPNLDPTSMVTKRTSKTLHELSDIATEGRTSCLRAARWYIKGVHEGPTADGVLLLCTSLEALVHPEASKKPGFDKRLIEEAICEAGGNPADYGLDVGRIAGLRGRIVHHGEETPESLSTAFYVLEEIVRLLLRRKLSMRSQDAWPVDHRAALKRSGVQSRIGRQRLKTMVSHAEWGDPVASGP